MSDKNNTSGKDNQNGFGDADLELSVDDLVASLNREISNLEGGPVGSGRESLDVRPVLPEEDPAQNTATEKSDGLDLIQALQMAVNESSDQAGTDNSDEDLLDLSAFSKPEVKEETAGDLFSLGDIVDKKTEDTDAELLDESVFLDDNFFDTLDSKEETVKEADVKNAFDAAAATVSPAASDVEAEKPAEDDMDLSDVVFGESPQFAGQAVAEKTVETAVEPVQETLTEEPETAVEKTAAEEPVIEETVTEEPETMGETVQEEKVEPVTSEEKLVQEEPAEEEAFDEPDPDVSDVSAGFSGGTEEFSSAAAAATAAAAAAVAAAATVEAIPATTAPAATAPAATTPAAAVTATPEATTAGATTAAPADQGTSMSAKEAKKAEKARQKEEKLRRKQEKLEAKEEKKQAKAERKENKEKKKGGVLKVLGTIFLLLILAAVIVYLALSNRYRTVFYDGTVINGVDCTGLTVEEAETIIARQMDDYVLTITFRGGKKETIKGDQIGFEYVPDGSVQEIKDMQVPVLWATAYFQKYSYDATAACNYDRTMLNTVISSLPECNLVSMEAPEDAYVTFSDETKKFELIPEKQGNKFNLSSLIEILEEEILKGTTQIDVEELGLYEEPERTKDDPELKQRQEDMNEIASACVTYQLPNGETQVLDGSILSTWISYDEKGNPVLDSAVWGEHIANYVADLATKVNTDNDVQEFRTISGGTVALESVLPGWIVDLDEEGKQLTEDLANHAVVTREPVYLQRAYADGNNGVGNTYVEVDLSQQYLWAVQDGVVILETPIVSGMMTYERYTPEGIYVLNGKQAGRWLRGEQYADGSYEYESWVDYWMPFNGGIGLHDATWRTEFGGSIYYGGGSHGCVNMPHSKAGELFGWISTGTPVVCYYSAGCPL